MLRVASTIIFPFLLCLSLSACNVSCVYSSKGSVFEKVKIQRMEQFEDIGIQAGREYVVESKIDLRGGQVNVPENVTITFKRGGAIVNGTLNGNGTRFNSKEEDVIGAKLEGTWCVDLIKDRVFSRDYLSDTEIIKNLNVIQSDTIKNEIHITRDYFVDVSKSGGVGLTLMSNTDLYFDATLTLVPNDFKSYQIVNIQRKKNVRIKGGRIVGDVGKHVYLDGTSSEWGMGVSIRESQNVLVEDIYITRCTGDGIYVSGGYESSIGLYDNASKNVTIRRVTCDANRRQGLSIIHVNGLFVRDCSFINTGQIEFTGPGYGIDIEPNVSNGRNMSVMNIVVDNCVITNNLGGAVSSSSSFEENGKVTHENILFSNCISDGKLLAKSTDLTFRKCSFKEARFSGIYAPTHITMESCTISGGNGIELYAPSNNTVDYKDRLLSIEIKECVVSVAEGDTGSSSLISCRKNHVDNIEYIKIENSQLGIPRIKTGSFKLTDIDYKGKLHIMASKIYMEGRDFDSSGLIISNSEIHCKRAVKSSPQTSNRIIGGE